MVPAGTWKHLPSRGRRPATVLYFDGNLRHSTDFGADNLRDLLSWLEAQPHAPPGWREAIVASAVDQSMTLLVAPNAIVGWLPQPHRGLTALRKSKGVRKTFYQERAAAALEKFGISRMTGIDADLQYIVERNLYGSPSLIGKHIVLIGCGMIGSHLARQLVQCGAGCDAALELFDTDTLRPGNLGRHLLGFDALNQPKARALAEHLRGFHPDLQVTPHYQDALRHWETIARADLIIDATGEFNVSVALNDLRIKSSRGSDELALLHSWVFGNGIAVQSFLNLNDGYACYRCLRPVFAAPWTHSPLKDVNAEATLAPARCGEGGYIPFAVDAPTVAASLALRAALDWASGHPGSRLRTITLDQEAGRTRKWTSPTRHPGCPACRERHD